MQSRPTPGINKNEYYLPYITRYCYLNFLYIIIYHIYYQEVNHLEENNTLL